MELLTIAEVAKMLGVSRWSIYNMISRKSRRTTLPHIKVGRVLRFRKSSIENWLAAQEIA
jgi:excisionase family DNA binding protein